jgi:hypothetical protein
MTSAPIFVESKVILRRDRDSWLMQAGWMNVSREAQWFRGNDGQGKKSCEYSTSLSTPAPLPYVTS